MMTTHGAPVSAPTNVQEVEQLVKRLYQPGTPKVIAQIDDQLKLLQNSSDGWQLADALLGSDDPNVRFFGALTFQVKLNTGARLDAAAAQIVLSKLLHWTAQLDRAGEGHLVRKKLCASLVTYFLRSPVPWQRPLLHLAASFYHGSAVDEERLSTAHDAIDQYLPTLNDSQLITILWLSGTLATEASRVDHATQENTQVHHLMEVLAIDASKVMQFALSQPVNANTGRVKAESLSTFLNWVNYAQPMWTAQQQALDYLRELVPQLVPLLTDEVLQNEAMDVFRDILESYTTFFQPQHMALLANIVHQYARPRMLQLLHNRAPEVIPVAQLIIAFGIANIQQVVEEPQNELGSKLIVQLLLAILESPGFPGDDDEVSIHSIEFWNTYIEYVNEELYSRQTDQNQPAWLEHDKAVCLRLSELLWSKMRTPPSDVAQDWSDAESEAFKEFRMDASDLMLSIYIRLGNEMLQRFISIAANSLSARNWQDLEAALFAINTLADNVLEDPSAEELLGQIFSSYLFREIADFSQSIPTQTRRTAIDLLGAYGQYIERHAEALPDTLRFLFASLETPGLYISASKSIESLCSTCRNSLTGELNGFLAQYDSFAQSETSEPYTNEKVIGAIASIIQAVSPERAKAQPLSALLDIVDSMVMNTRQLLAQPDLEKAAAIGVSSIDCLVKIGKGLQVPEDVPIDLCEDDEKPTYQDSFWKCQEGQAIQLRILNVCQTMLQLLPGVGEVVDSVCQVFKAGFAETEPGPFVFPPNMIVSFLEQCTIATSHLETVLSTVCTLIVQYSRKDQPRIDSEISRIYAKAVTLVQHLHGEPSQDPGIAQACIDVFNRMIGRYSNIFFDVAGSGTAVQLILDFAIKALDGPDLMPKRSATDFWRRVVASKQDQTDRAICDRAEQVINAYGLPLCQALMNQIAGRGQRSELDSLCEPLKVMIQQRAQTKSWLETALTNDALPDINPSVGDIEKRRFVQQVISLRGANKTKDVVKNFYAACRGTVTSYT
ncbi:hypothetical protein DOTSEDRAFT_174398 [Dothistroma septosporum NZE10]|uniref:Uncharacterized protein n=1 Tax=Dothistroma septosporum (strain NZE10 / CBS 128990) TaxID=675120 RepID=M2YNF3_DOTSN|nr:hypothetical protein DOTSEDRAFT_174398 [Dothistroma septosporum NZE10]